MNGDACPIDPSAFFIPNFSFYSVVVDRKCYKLIYCSDGHDGTTRYLLQDFYSCPTIR